MAQSCPLKTTLILRDLQSGVAGANGRVWTITADCRFTIARQFGLHAADPERRGELSPEQQARLGAAVGRLTGSAVPRQLGAPQTNARAISLSYGSIETVLTLPPGGGDFASLEPAAAADATALLALARVIDEVTRG